MSPEQILLSVRANEASYRFVCPRCAEPVQKRADRKVVALLVSAGVQVDDAGPLSVPIPEAEPPFGAEPAAHDLGRGSAVPSVLGSGDEAPFTEADCDRFRLQLADEDLLAEFASGR